MRLRTIRSNSTTDSNNNSTYMTDVVAKAVKDMFGKLMKGTMTVGEAVHDMRVIEARDEAQSSQQVMNINQSIHQHKTNQATGQSQANLTSAESHVSPISDFRKRFLLWDLEQRYPFNDDVTNTGDNYFMYMCSGVCGGWGDQLKGTFFSYLIANLTGRRFKAQYLKHMCGMTNYVVPNRVNWSVSDTWKPSANESGWHRGGGFKSRVSTVNLTELFHMDKKYIFSLWNLDYVTGMMKSTVYKNELSWMKGLSRAEVFAAIYQHLFKLHPRLQAILDKFLYNTLPTPKHRLVCIHIRLGREANWGDWKIRNSLSNLPKIWSWVANHTMSEHDRLFLMSDSNTVISSAYNQTFADKLVTVPGPIVHINKFDRKNMTRVCDGVEKLILEHHVVMNCDVFVRGISGLSDIAAAVRGSDTGLYCLLADGTIEACERNHLPDFH